MFRTINLAKIVSHLTLLIIGLIIGYFTGTTSNRKMLERSIVEISPLPTASLSIAPISISPPLNIPGKLPCVEDRQELGTQLSSFADSLEKKALLYNDWQPEKLQDCSGIFLRTVEFFNRTCQYSQYPNPKKTRNTKSIVQWYYDHTNLVLIGDPMKNRHLIQAGAILFFGQPSKRYSQPTIQQLASNKGVIHMGVVTEVELNEAGEVIGYLMFHGRSDGKIAKRTDYHKVKSKHGASFSFGNDNQQWVAVAHLLTPK